MKYLRMIWDAIVETVLGDYENHPTDSSQTEESDYDKIDREVKEYMDRIEKQAGEYARGERTLGW